MKHVNGHSLFMDYRFNTFYRCESQVGYTLGHPTQCELHPDSERNLSPATCAILRILVNACLVWTACTNEVVYLPVRSNYSNDI